MIDNSAARTVFELKEALLMNRSSAEAETHTVSATDLTGPSAGTISNLVMMYRLVEILAIASGRTDRGLVPRHKRIPGLSNPRFKVGPFFFLFTLD